MRHDRNRNCTHDLWDWGDRYRRGMIDSSDYDIKVRLDVLKWGIPLTSLQ
jgi:hypothetical protein